MPNAPTFTERLWTQDVARAEAFGDPDAGSPNSAAMALLFKPLPGPRYIFSGGRRFETKPYGE